MLARLGAVVALTLAASCASVAEAPGFRASLSGAQEVPAVASPGSGAATLTLDPATRVLSYTVEYAGLTGPVGAAHIHGPAAPGANAGPVVPITVTPSPITGSATLTDAQVADLKAGLYYVNLHTAAHRGGEIRGQITAAP